MPWRSSAVSSATFAARSDASTSVYERGGAAACMTCHSDPTVSTIGPAPGGLDALYDRLNSYAPEEVAELEEEGLMRREAFDLSTAMAITFPGQNVDLSPETFDALLAPRIEGWLDTARQNGVI